MFEKYSYIKFHESYSTGNLVVPCGWTGRQTDKHTASQPARQTDRQAGRQTDTQTDRQTDMVKPKVAFRNFANAPKKLNAGWNTKIKYAVKVRTEFLVRPVVW
jgi:hypothetical protein